VWHSNGSRSVAPKFRRDNQPLLWTGPHRVRMLRSTTAGRALRCPPQSVVRYVPRIPLMATLNYSRPEGKQISNGRSLAVFAPAFVAVTMYVVCCHFFQGDDAVGILLLAAVLAAEVLTIVFLCIWRRRLLMFSIVGGWIIAAIGAAFLGIVAAVNLGLLQE
jgi:hypothetical protein